MELMEVIGARRSVRSYAPTPVERAAIERLLDAAVQAPTGMNAQPWVFGVIQGVEALREYSTRARTHLLSVLDQLPGLASYRDTLSSPDFNLFYDAPALVLIYGNPNAPTAQVDCCLAAENLMLAACEMGLGTCWIGFSQAFFDLPEVKRELGVPEEYRVVAPLILGTPNGTPNPPDKRPPQILFWR